ncbi:hypothetical protein ONZ43_g1170 [Nemania bipapillata]|uniref:Uncharacterized protein n=1 Tax=Nemania bipapillata TaxID=110536 RepID=A0ACC2J5B8_9PEZI|nr:hypothetical protein ONZ43_g1170 [Nemania bipapillata]
MSRHQLSLDDVINPTAAIPLSDSQRASAKHKFNLITEHFEVDNGSLNTQYSPSRLVRLTYEYALSEESRDNFLRAFFQATALSIEGNDDSDIEDFRSPFFGFADHLLDNFFLPLKASTKKTPQPSPAYHSAVERVQGGGVAVFPGTPDRVSALRGACLIRDHHRCVISRKFDLKEAADRMRRDGNDALDDDGGLLREDENSVDVLKRF